MKILFVAELKKTEVCGVTVHINNLMKGLNESGNQTEFISVSSIPKIVRKIFISVPFLIMKTLSLDVRWMWEFIVFEIYMNFYIVYKHLIKIYDVINVEGAFSYNSTFLVRKFFKIPVLLTEHSYRSGLIEGRGISKNSFTEKYLINIEKKVLKSAQLIVAVDSRIKNYLISDYDAAPQKIVVKINFIDVDEFKPRDGKGEYRKQFGIPNKDLVILCPRRLDPKNGVKYGALSAIYLKEILNDNFIIVFMGQGGEEAEIKKIVKENNLEDNILILKVIPHEKMKYLYNACDIVIIPSINFFGLEEATSLSALESMASEVPTIVSNIGGLREIITDNETGFLVEEKNPQNLAMKILEVYNNKNITTINKKARNYVTSKASHIERANEFLELYNSIINGR